MFNSSELLALINTIIRQSERKPASVYRMHLIMYFAMGWYAQIRSSTLLNEQAVATVSGPRIPSILHSFGESDHELIDTRTKTPQPSASDEALAFIAWVVDEYYDLPKDWLTAESKGKHSAWSAARRKNVAVKQQPIETDLICAEIKTTGNPSPQLLRRDYSCASLKAANPQTKQTTAIG